jgi:hypothetical protein
VTSRQQNASVHDSQQFDGLLNQANTSSDVYAEHARFAQPDSSARERQSSPSQEQEHPPPYDAGAVGCRIKDESARSAQTGAWAYSFTPNQERKMTVERSGDRPDEKRALFEVPKIGRCRCLPTFSSGVAAGGLNVIRPGNQWFHPRAIMDAVRALSNICRSLGRRVAGLCTEARAEQKWLGVIGHNSAADRLMLPLSHCSGCPVEESRWLEPSCFVFSPFRLNHFVRKKSQSNLGGRNG